MAKTHEETKKDMFDDGKFENTSLTELVNCFKLTSKIKTDFINTSEMSREEIKMLVDLYYQLQDNRKRSR